MNKRVHTPPFLQLFLRSELSNPARHLSRACAPTKEGRGDADTTERAPEGKRGRSG